MMDYLRIKNWNLWQTFRKDRGTPPWIKVHRNLMTNSKWAVLTDEEKGQIVSIWIIAADNEKGEIPYDAAILKKICQLDNKPNINKFIGLQLLTTTCPQHDNQLTTTCPQHDAPEAEAEAERGEEKRRDRKRFKRKKYTKKKNPKKQKRLAWKQPGMDELRKYAHEQRLTGFDAEAFFDHHNARGWILSNGKKMVCWTSAVRTWERNSKKYNNSTDVNSPDSRHGMRLFGH